jgi:hypothetical protein
MRELVAGKDGARRPLLVFRLCWKLGGVLPWREELFSRGTVQRLFVLRIPVVPAKPTTLSVSVLVTENAVVVFALGAAPALAGGEGDRRTSGRKVRTRHFRFPLEEWAVFAAAFAVS